MCLVFTLTYHTSRTYNASVLSVFQTYNTVKFLWRLMRLIFRIFTLRHNKSETYHSPVWVNYTTAPSPSPSPTRKKMKEIEYVARPLRRTVKKGKDSSITLKVVWFRTKNSTQSCLAVMSTSFRVWVQTFPFPSTSHSSGISAVTCTCSSTRHFSCHCSFWYWISRQLNVERFYKDMITSMYYFGVFAGQILLSKIKTESLLPFLSFWKLTLRWLIIQLCTNAQERW